MIEAGVRNVKDHLSEYLRRVRRGERVVITDRGRPVAALVGLGDEADVEAAWNLVHQGLGEWQGGKPLGLEHAPHVEGQRAAEIVLEDRR